MHDGDINRVAEISEEEGAGFNPEIFTEQTYRIFIV
jgi:hypothetical protein